MDKKKVGWLMDYPLNRSGGHKTIIDYANALYETGKYEVDIYVKSNPDINKRLLKKVIEEFLIPTKANILPSWDIHGYYDILFATWYPNAPIVAQYPNSRNKVYFVQDYDPFLNFMSYAYLKAEKSYELGLDTITMGKWLSYYLQKNHGAKCYPLYLGADLHDYKQVKSWKEDAICIIFQPEKFRRCSELVEETIIEINRLRPDIQIYTYGSKQPPHRGKCIHKYVLDINECNDLYNRCLLGISISCTNPSRIPYEMMASGLPVIELFRENNQYDFTENIITLARPDPISIAQEAIQLFDNKEKREMQSKNALDFISNYSLANSKLEFIKVIEGLIETNTLQKQHIERNQFKIPKDYSILNINRTGSKYRIETIENNTFKNNWLDNLYNQRAYSYQFNIITELTRKSIVAVQLLLTLFLQKIEAIKQDFINLWNILLSKISYINYYLKTRNNIKKQVDVISFDLFDTLVRRKVHPDYLKVYTAYNIYLKHSAKFYQGVSPENIYRLRLKIEYELYSQSIEEGKAGEYTLEEVLKNMLLVLLKDIKSINMTEEIDRLINLETEKEKALMYADYKGVKLLRDTKAKTKLILSDFYMCPEHTKKIISSHIDISLVPEIMTSCKLSINKSSGKLFDYFLSKWQIDPGQWTHIGDNIYSDCLIPSKKGINGTLFVNFKEEIKKSVKTRTFTKRFNITNFFYSELLKFQQNNKITPPNKLGNTEKQLFKLGIKYAPIFYFFVQYIYEQALQNQASKVYYFTREGEFFQKLHTIISKSLQFKQFKEVPSDILEVSRLATFSPTIEKISINGFKNLWLTSEEHSPKSFCKVINLDFKKLEKYFIEYGFNPDKKLNLKKSSNFQRLINNNEVINIIERTIEKDKINMKGYLQDKLGQNTNIYICDIGWRGTIQDNIAQIFKDKKFIGYYLGLLPPKTPAIENSEKSGFLSSYHNPFEDPIKFCSAITFIEMLCNSPTGSTKKYERHSNGKYTAVRNNIEGEDRIHNKYIQYFQAGVIETSKKLINFSHENIVSAIEGKKIAVKLMQQLQENPEWILTKVYFELMHDDIFGYGGIKNMQKLSRFTFIEIMKAVFNQKAKNEFIEKANKTMWHNGFYIYNDKTRILNKIHNYLFK